jgi:hypothetical protein
MEDYLDNAIKLGVLWGGLYVAKFVTVSFLKRSRFASVREEFGDKRFMLYPFPADFVYKLGRLTKSQLPG